MSYVQSPNQIHYVSLTKLAHLFQKEIPSLIDIYIKESEALMEKLKRYVSNAEFKYILRTASELRLSSLEIGALHFSFLILSLEIAASEHRAPVWDRALQTIDQQYHQVVHELTSIKSTQAA